MDSDTFISNIAKQAKEYFNDAKGSHGWDHTIRVYNLCIHIGKKENADIVVLKAAALLHDIARHEQDIQKGKICHAEHGAKYAKKILEDYDISEEQKQNIIHCIESHRFRNSHTPNTLEAKVLFDADKLDSIGAVGIGRAFLFSGEVGANLHDKDVDIKNTLIYSKEDTAYREFLVKLRYVKNKILTKEGGKIAFERDKFMHLFFDRLNKETDGIL